MQADVHKLTTGVQAGVNTLACDGPSALQGAHVVRPFTVLSIRQRILQRP